MAMCIHLREARKRKGLTQAEVGEAIGRDQSTISKYEAGTARIDVDVAVQYAAVLGIPVVELLYPDLDATQGAPPLRQRPAAAEGGPAAEATGHPIEPLSEAA